MIPGEIMLIFTIFLSSSDDDASTVDDDVTALVTAGLGFHDKSGRNDEHGKGKDDEGLGVGRHFLAWVVRCFGFPKGGKS